MIVTEITTNKRGCGGFSLVEVTLALGITAVALVSLMGMLPQGMKTLQRANDQAVMGRIHQQIVGEIQLTPWEAEKGGMPPLDSFDRTVRYYDDQGIELPASDKGEFNHIYTARILLPRSGQSMPNSVGGASHGGVSIPGDDELTPELVRLVVVEITGSSDGEFLSDPVTGFDNLSPKVIQTYRTLAVKMGRVFDIQ